MLSCYRWIQWFQRQPIARAKFLPCMTPPAAAKAPELTLVPPADARSTPMVDQVPDPASQPPKRMTKRCRRCGKTVPTLAALSWRARKIVASAETAAGQVFRARVETADAGARDDLLKRAHRLQQDGAEEAQQLLSDLKRLQGHDRRCHAGSAVGPRLAPSTPSQLPSLPSAPSADTR
jgi:hypothetical protein